jgi:hypothetical protein
MTRRTQPVTMNAIEIILCNTTSGQLSRYSDSLRADGPGIERRWVQATSFSISVQTGHEARQASPKGYRIYLPGVKRPRCGADHKPSRAEVKERVKLYLYPSCTCPYTRYPNKGDLPQSLQSNTGPVHSIRPRPPPATAAHTQYSLIILSLDAVPRIVEPSAIGSYAAMSSALRRAVRRQHDIKCT